MKIEKRNFLHFLSFLLAALMIFSLTPLSVYAADRSVTPKYDFSSVDDINIYDTYEKRETATGISYVRVGKQHFYDWNNGFGINDLVYLGGENITGKNQEVTESIQKDYNLFMKTKGYTYIDLLSEYQGTPSFSSPIFTFDDGKFNMTYTTN